MNFFDEQNIIDYLEGALPLESRTLFEAELAKNDQLQQEVEDYKTAIEVVNENGKKKLLKKIKTISDNKNQINLTNNQTTKTINMNTNKKSSNSWIYGLVAGLALLVIGYNVLGKTDSKDPAEIFAENYKKESTQTATVLKSIATKNLTSRGADTGGDEKVMYKGKEITAAEFSEMEKLRRDTLMMGIKLFDQSKWRESKEVLHAYTSNYKTPVDDYSTALYYLAKTSLNTDLYKVAIPVFDEFLAIPNENKKLTMDAEWERALCYLNVDEMKAKEAFDVLAGNNNHAYQDEAKAILAYFE